MATQIEIIDPETIAKRRRERRIQLVAFAVFIGLFIYPEIQQYKNKWSALRGARKLTTQMNLLRSRAIATKTAVEMRIVEPDLIEVFQVSSCGPQAQANKIAESRLSDLEPGLRFVPAEWVQREVFPLQEIDDVLVKRYCYDPLFGSSLQADGIATGSFFVMNSESYENKRADQAIRIFLKGTNGDVSFF